MSTYDSFFCRELWSAIRADYSAKLPESTDLTLLYKVTLTASATVLPVFLVCMPQMSVSCLRAQLYLVCMAVSGDCVACRCMFVWSRCSCNLRGTGEA